MPLQKQNLNINFAKGLDTKTDPWQLEAGNFLALENSVFTTGNRITKRNGYQLLSGLPSSTATYLTTFGNGLVGIGDGVYPYNPETNTWNSQLPYRPVSLSTISLIKNNINQTQCDAAVAPNGLVCTVYSEINAGVTDYKYAVSDSVTGQNVIAPQSIPIGSGAVTGSPRVFVLGNFFVIVFTNLISSVSHLQYVAISLINPTNVTTNADIASAYIPSTGLSWDGAVVSTQLFIAYNTTSGGQSVKVTYLTATTAAAGGTPVAPATFSSYKATLMSVCADITNPTNPIVWVNFYRSDTSLGYALALSATLGTVLAPTATILSGTILNLASAATGGVCSLFFEVSNTYSYGASLPTNYIDSYTITQGGTVSSLSTVVRSVGLASKAFIFQSTAYFLAAYSSSYQPTYFLIDGSSTDANPYIFTKIAYGNGGGYLTAGLPSISQIGSNEFFVPYLFKDSIAAVNKGTNLPSGTQVAGIYSQTGINLASIVLGSSSGVDTAEIGGDLIIGGGFLWMYDGFLPVEQNFFLWPDNVIAATQSDPAPTGNISSSSNPTVITSVSSVAGITVGMTVTDTTNAGAIPANTTVVAVGTTTVTMSAAATGTHSGDSFKFVGNQAAQQYYYQVTYEWSDNQGNIYRSAPSIPVTVTTSSGNTSVVLNIPTLRLTLKVNNPVKIVIYRWSAAQQVYYQVTSLTSPILNSTTTDSVSFIDVQTDAQILGNNIIYTNGGVVEDVNAPATNIMTLFDTRLWLVDAEDQNLLWFSKQVIESTPVEMSDLFTFYVAPTTASQGSTGPITALAPLDDKLIIFKANAIYYINGSGPDNTGASNQYSQPIFITSTVGCNNQNSIVFQPNGLMFQSEKGIWLLGRDLSTSYIGAAVEQFNSSTVNSSVNVPATNQVRFTLSTGQTLMYDYYYNQWGTFVGVPAVSSCIYQGLHTFLNDFVQVFQESPGLYVDGGNPVLLGLTTSWFNLAGLQGYIRSYFIYILGQYYSPHKLQVSIAYNYNPSPSQVSLITPVNYSPAYGGPNPNPANGTDAQSPYGQLNPYGGPGNVEWWRVFLTKQRCSAFQISIQEVYDSSFGVSPGQGLTLSGLNLVYGIKKGFRPQANVQSIGGGTV